MLRVLLRSQSMRTALALGLGGGAFMLGNLVLARALPSAEYGLLSLFIGILSVASLAAPLGLDLVVARRGLQLGRPLRRAILAASLGTATVTAAVGALAYDLDASLLASLFVATVAAGAIQAAVANFQGQQRFGAASWLLQISNVLLLPVALVTLSLGFRTALMPCILIAATNLVGAVVTWNLVVRAERPDGLPPRIRTLWREALSLVAITAAACVFLQLERLVLVPSIGVEGLALFGVVAALVGSPYRMIQGAVLFALIPGLRAAPGVAGRRKLLAREMTIIGGALACGSLVIWIVAPPVAHGFLGGRYDITGTVMLAAIVSGLLKVFSAFATSVAVSLGDDRDLRLVSLSAWVSVGIAVAGAFAAAPWGLAGVLYGISVGWLVRTLVAAWIAAPHLMHAGSNLPHPVR